MWPGGEAQLGSVLVVRSYQGCKYLEHFHSKILLIAWILDLRKNTNHHTDGLIKRQVCDSGDDVIQSSILQFHFPEGTFFPPFSLDNFISVPQCMHGGQTYVQFFYFHKIVVFLYSRFYDTCLHSLVSCLISGIGTFGRLLQRSRRKILICTYVHKTSLLHREIS